jgi:DNA repair photolyase
MITGFSGEFLFHPILLEMSMNACSHQCVYCFANLRNSNRCFNARKFATEMDKLYNKKTFEAQKLREGYPVVLSNLTDPFSDNNLVNTEAVLEQFNARNIPVYFQTKTGKRMLEIVSGMKPSTFYITITTYDDAISKRIEPFAPVISERIEYIKKLLQLGHVVMVGINPLAREWMPPEQLNEMITKLSALGVSGFVFNKLHINNQNIETLNKRDFGGVNFKDYFKRGGGDYFQTIALEYAKYGGIAYNQPATSNGWEKTKKLYKTIPTIQDFVNYIVEKYKDETAEIEFEQFYEFNKELEYVFNTPHILDKYVISIARNAWKGNPQNQRIIGAEHLLKVFWNDRRPKISPQNNMLFEKIKEKDGFAVLKYNGGKFIRDNKIINLKRETL